jgi:hypothetical protein
MMVERALHLVKLIGTNDGCNVTNIKNYSQITSNSKYVLIGGKGRIDGMTRSSEIDGEGSRLLYGLYEKMGSPDLR